MRESSRLTITPCRSGAANSRISASGDIAHLAHIGGVVVAVLWLWGKPIWGRIGASFADADMKRRRQRSVEEQEEMDRLLAKVHREGIHALSAQEKKFMKKMSKHYREPQGK